MTVNPVLLHRKDDGSTCYEGSAHAIRWVRVSVGTDGEPTGLSCEWVCPSCGSVRLTTCDGETARHDLYAWWGGGVEANGETAALCRFCGRVIVNDPDDGWVCPEATGDDSIWRETCDSHDTFLAEHVPVGGKAWEEQE